MRSYVADRKNERTRSGRGAERNHYGFENGRGGQEGFEMSALGMDE